MLVVLPPKCCTKKLQKKLYPVWKTNLKVSIPTPVNLAILNECVYAVKGEIKF